MDELDENQVGPYFHECFYMNGGLSLTQTDPLNEYRHRYFEYLRNYKNHPLYAESTSLAYFHIIRNDEVGAMVKAHEGFNFIGIQEGAFFNLVTFFDFLLSDSMTLTDIGRAKMEKPWILKMSECNWMWDLKTVIHSVKFIFPPPENYPQDEVRAKYSKHLAKFALDFLFFHEMGHIVYGHLQYARNNQGQNSMDETGSVMGLDPRISRSLELNADYFAIEQTGLSWLSDPEGIVNTIFSDQEEALRLWCLSIGLFFLAFNRCDSDWHAQKKSSYPHPALRLTAAYDVTMKLAQKQGTKTMSLLEHAWEKAFMDIGQIVNRFKLKSSAWHEATLYQKEIYEDYRVNLDYFISSLSKELEPFQR